MLLGLMWMMAAVAAGFMAGRISMYGMYGIFRTEDEETAGETSVRRENGKQGKRGRRHHGGAEAKIWSVGSPVAGEVTLQEEGEHPTVVILAAGDRLYAPAAGKITRLFPMGNAFLFTTEFGTELYIQAGYGEDELLARHYRPRVLQNEVVSKGKVLLEFDRQGLETEGVVPEVSVCVENGFYGGEIFLTAGRAREAREEILQVQEPAGRAVALPG